MSSSSRRARDSSSRVPNGQRLHEAHPTVVALDPQRLALVEHRGGVELAVEVVGERGQRRGADGLGRRSSERSTGTGANPSLDGRQLLGVRRLPEVEPRIVDGVGEEAVGHHRVDAVPEEGEVGVGATGLGDHHPLGGHHQPDAGAVGVAEQLPDGLEAVEHLLAGREHVVAGHRQRRDPARAPAPRPC